MSDIGVAEVSFVPRVPRSTDVVAYKYPRCRSFLKAGTENGICVNPQIMCGRFTLKSSGRVRFDRVDRPNLLPLFPRYNIAPSQNVLTVVQHDGVREAAFLQWGLIPSWSKDGKGFINERSETIEDKPSFSESGGHGPTMARTLFASHLIDATSDIDQGACIR